MSQQSQSKEPDAKYFLVDRALIQLLSSPDFLSNNKFDARILSNISAPQAFSFSIVKDWPKCRGGNFLRNQVGELLAYQRSVEAFTTKYGIKGIQAVSGGGSTVEVDQRSWKEKHLTMRDEKEAKERGKIVEVQGVAEG